MNEIQDRTPTQLAFTWEAGVKPRGPGARVDSVTAGHPPERPMFSVGLMEAVVERRNMFDALHQVRANQGSPGVDGMTVDALPEFLKGHWPRIKEQLMQGLYQPQVVKRVEIPKPGRQGTRKLGIPCVVDRLIQHAMLQVLQRPWDPTFSESSYGFRPGRSAHQAVAQAQAYIEQGYSYVVDIDLETFFDRVCHDRLMSRLAQQIADKRTLKLIRRYLQAGILENGLTTVPTEGTPQGSPLSPFLSNVVLDELDKELEARGHRFCRYADDSNIYVRSARAGARVLASISRFITQRLKLAVNWSKSAVDRPWNRSFLGFSFTGGKLPQRRKIAPKALARFTARVKVLTRRNQGRSLPQVITALSRYLRGWIGYFGFCQTPAVLRDLDSWIRHRLRCLQWKHWKVYHRRKAELIKRGMNPKLAHTTAWSAKGPWKISHTPGVRMALNNQFFDRMGLTRLSAHCNI
ncbi:MAG TPA: group II intron reverse transcriptase/maturase [Candidatus Acidoferrales bacterium]|nr:group II intron reverse transcriptase/maturase [Candidatus Acidoferrales bacterium]